MSLRVSHGRPTFGERQRRIAADWEEFGNIVHNYLGIPYKHGGRAVKKVTGEPAGVATQSAGLVCTSFVDAVLSQYVYDDPTAQLDSYNFGRGTNIFDQYGLQRLATDVEPENLKKARLLPTHVYGIVFHMKSAWTKRTRSGPKRMDPGSRIHVGFVAFRNGKLFLIHASGKKGVHIVAWEIFLRRFGRGLRRFGGAQVKGAKFLSIYEMGTA